eukprot:5429020-Prymnesium_polylepis.2
MAWEGWLSEVGDLYVEHPNRSAVHGPEAELGPRSAKRHSDLRIVGSASRGVWPSCVEAGNLPLALARAPWNLL